MGGAIATWSRRRKAAVGVASVGAVVASLLLLSNLGDDGRETLSTASDETTTAEAPTTTDGSTTTTVETTTTVAPTTTSTPPTTAPPTTAAPVTPPTTAPPATTPPTTMPTVPPEFPFVRRGLVDGPPYFGIFYGQVPCCDRSRVRAACRPGPLTVTVIDNGSDDPVPPPLEPVYFGVWVDETTTIREMAPAADGTVITGTVQGSVIIAVASPSNFPVRVQYDCRG